MEKPPYKITPEILKLVSFISEQIGRLTALHLDRPDVELRKENRIKTIQASLEIEGNTLSLEQVTAILNNSRVSAPKKDILEVTNAIEVYQSLEKFNAFKLSHLLKAHKILMKGLIPDAGKLRSGNVGITKGAEIAHLAPPAHLINQLLKNLLLYAKTSNDLLLIKSCVFHYEFEFIHPFTDGNGRMGRLWQTLLLKEYHPIFEFLPIETLIKKSQNEYYEALGESDKAGSSTAFLLFMLTIIKNALNQAEPKNLTKPKGSERILQFHRFIGSKDFSRKEYLNYFKELSTSTASRDLKEAVAHNILKVKGEKNKTKYNFQ